MRCTYDHAPNYGSISLDAWRRDQERLHEKVAGEREGSRKTERDFLRRAGCDKYGRDTSH